MRLFLGMCLALCLCGCQPEKPPEPAVRVIAGQVFVRSQGGDTFKMSGVSVAAVPEAGLAPVIEQCKREEAGYYQSWEDAQKSADAVVRSARDFLAQEQRALSNAMANVGIRAQILKPFMDRVKQAKYKVELAEHEANKVTDGFPSRSWVDWLFDGRPLGAVTNVTTDADGRFVVSTTATNRLLMLARASRKIGDKSEVYHWAVPATNDAVMLYNDNMVTAVR